MFGKGATAHMFITYDSELLQKRDANIALQLTAWSK